MQTKLSIVIPCYNEKERFKDGLEHFLNYLNKQKYTWELLLVNDGSTDNTLDQMEKAAKSNKKVKIVSYRENKGKGYAIVQGVKHSKGQLVLFSDLDHSVPISTVDTFFKYFEKGFDVVIGSRRVEGSKFIKKQNLLRENLGRGFTLLVRIFIDWPIKDATCGFKAFRNQAAKKLFSKISIYGWAFDAELLFLCKKYGYKYAQAPVTWEDVKGSKVTLTRDIVASLVGLLKIRINDLKKKY